MSSRYPPSFWGMLSRASHSCVVLEFCREALLRRLRRLEFVVEPFVLDCVERDIFEFSE